MKRQAEDEALGLTMRTRRNQKQDPTVPRRLVERMRLRVLFDWAESTRSAQAVAMGRPTVTDRHGRS
eukprot:3936151-Rhodomonas_salina.4